jgi:acyl-CoA oxidase
MQVCKQLDPMHLPMNSPSPLLTLLLLHPPHPPHPPTVPAAEEHREQVRKQLGALLEEGINPLTFFDRDYKKYFYLAECLSLVDLSLMVKSGVQFSLWGGSVLNLGSEQHRRKYADDIAAFRLPGCFAMTELKHGSNVGAFQQGDKRVM